MFGRLLTLVCLGALLSFAPPAVAGAPAVWTPEQLAERVERQASGTTYDDVERFGRQTLAARQPDRLRRLEHVAWLFLDESDFRRFAVWNGALKSEAAREHNARFQQIADLDQLRARYDQGDLASAARVAAFAATALDPCVRAHALMLQAYFLTEQGQAAMALKLLFEADHLAIAVHSSGLRSAIWEVEGLALIRLQDLTGSAEAFGRSQFEFAAPGYPDPNYDTIWNMSMLAARLGRLDLARRLYEVDRKLSAHSGVEVAQAWDDVLCAVIAEQGDRPREVLACLKPLAVGRPATAFLLPRVLPVRAIAYARLGRVDLARRDAAKLDQLRRQHALSAIVLKRLPEVQAELLHAEHRDAEAFEAERRLAHQSKVADAQVVSEGVGQLTGMMAEQISFRQNELATARRNLQLAHSVLGYQQAMSVAGALFGVIITALLVWQWQVSRALRVAQVQAEAASLAKTEFLANMSHEIRTPLNGLLTMAEVMERDPLPGEQRERLAVVRRSGGDLLRLLNDILDLSKIEAGKLELETVGFDMAATIRSTVSHYRSVAEEKGLALVLELSPDAEGWRQGDPTRLRQILSNFVSNALKFTAAGEVRIEVEGSGPGGRDGVRIAVRDTGLGIAADKMHLLFQNFSQVDASTTRRFGGSGLGLSICHNLATLMGGRVWAESRAGSGSVFFADLPLPRGADEATAANGAREPGDGRMAGSLRLLAAEDNATNRLVLSTIMGVFGCELTLVENGAEAVQAWRDGDYDAILMDIQMPVLDGIEATREIRRLETQLSRPRTGIIALSANTFAHQIETYMAAGVDAHVAKPIELAALQAALESTLAALEETRAAA